MNEASNMYYQYNPYFRNNYDRYNQMYINNYKNQLRKNIQNNTCQNSEVKQAPNTKDKCTYDNLNQKNSITNNCENVSNTKDGSTKLLNGLVTFNPRCFSDSNEFVIEIFGIKIYLDDLIILGLLYFLYTEEVKDEMLYISLIFLLIG